jgi:conjugative relaxase-like TrwC/TraI family protein
VTASLHKLGAGAQAGLYYTNDSAREAKPSRRDEYYAQDGGGVWWSSGESVVRHGAAIDVASFRDLCAGRDPRTGKALVRGAGEGHWAGLDVTFTPGKSVSVLWMAGTADQREIIEKAHQAAVDRALRFIVDEKLIAVRQGAGGVDQSTPSDLIVAKFTHFTTREGDPNIHSHCVCMSVAGAPKEGGSKRYATSHLTIEPKNLFRWQIALGAAYRSALAEQLAVSGLTPRPAGRGQWELVGLPQEFLEIFSKRSHQIEDLVGRDASSSQKEIAALRTRNAKDSVPTGEELERRWRAELAPTGIAPWEAALHLAHGRDIELDQIHDHERELFDPPEIAGQGPVAVAASALFRHDSVIDRRQLLERGFVEAALQKFGPDAVYAELSDLETRGDLLRLSADCWTTPDVAACEAAMLRAAARPQEREWLKPDALVAALEKSPHLTAEQRDAVRLAARADGVSIIEAGAGTGKTTLARALVDAAQGSGLKVIGLAPSWVAADELARSTEIESVAIARWRYDHEHGKGRELDASTIIIVDEAGMAGTRDMSAVLTAAQERGAKVVLVGDRRQLSSVSGASALKGVSEVVRQGAVLDGVRRQTVDWQTAASVLMARGDAEAGLRAYAARNRMELVTGQAAAQERVISIWKEQRERHGDDVLIITRRNSDCASLNKLAREVLKSEGLIQGDEIQAPSLDRDDKPVMLSLARGDRVRFGESLSHLEIRNGNRGVVEEIRRDSSGELRVAFMLDDGRRIEDDWRCFARERLGKKVRPPQIVHAYAGTVYAAQGRTAAASVIYVAAPTDAREVYVGLTRHINDSRIVVERERLDALCRQRQTDHRINPTETAMRERLFDEARRYREKANVADFCADRSPFIRTGYVNLPNGSGEKWTIERAVVAARAFRDAHNVFDSSRLVTPVWRLIEQGWNSACALPEKLRAIVDNRQYRDRRMDKTTERQMTHER